MIPALLAPKTVPSGAGMVTSLSTTMAPASDVFPCTRMPVPVAHSETIELCAISPSSNVDIVIEDQQRSGEIFRAPLLGGTPERLASDVDSNVTISPDGQKVAFMRYDNPEPGKYQLVVRSLVGSAESMNVSGLTGLVTYAFWSSIFWAMSLHWTPLSWLLATRRPSIQQLLPSSWTVVQ